MGESFDRRRGPTGAEPDARELASGTMPAGSRPLESGVVPAIGDEAQLRSAVARVPLLLFAMDPAGTVTLSEGGALSLLGLVPGQLVGESLPALYGDARFVDDAGEQITGHDVVARALSGAHVHGIAYVGDRVFDLRLLPLHGASGEIAGALGIGSDVTERARAEEALRAQEGRLTAMLDSIAEAVIATDASGCVRHMNPWAERLTGWSSKEAVGRPVSEVVRLTAAGTDDAIGELEAMPPGSTRPSTIPFATLVAKSGVARPVSATWARILDAHGGIIVTLRDVADERLAADALARSEASFRALIEGSPEMILIHRDDRIVYVNRTLLDALRYAPEELIGRSPYDLVHTDDRDGVQERQRAIERQAPQTIPRTVRMLRKDGQIVCAENVAIRLEFDGAPATVVMGRDVTDRDAMHQQLLRADRMAALGTLSAGVAHEINNPLTYVLVNVEHVMRRLRAHMAGDEELPADEAAALVDALTQALDGASRVRQIVRDLMTFSRGHVDQKGLVDVRRVLEASIQMTMHEMRHRARLEKRLSEVPPVEANEARLGQVFLHLLVNAAQSIPEGDASKHAVTVETSTEGDRAVVTITDTGVGIPPEHLSRIFDPFFTTRPNGGTGIGLSIAHGIVRSFGGELTIASEVGKGTRARVTLPAAPGYAAAASLSSMPPHTAIAVRRRVLVIDDDRGVADAIALALRDEHDVEVTTDGRSAIDRFARGERFDVILCDLMMPEMTGMDFYREVLRVAPQLVGRLVFMSGGAFTPRARAFLEGLPNRLIEKPPDVAKLRELVRRRGA